MNFDISKLMQQAQKMQKQIKKSQEEKESIQVKSESGAGLVKITMNGKYDVKTLSIDQSLMYEDKEILEDLVVAAINSAVKKVEEITKTDINKMAQNAGIKLPDDFKFPF